MADKEKATGPKHTPATRATPGKDAKSEAPKRKMLTDEERIAKLEADLKAAREKKEAKHTKKVSEAQAKLRNITDQVEFTVYSRIRPIEDELRALDVDVTPFEVRAPQTEDTPSTVAAAEGSKPSTTTSRVKD